jgi:hypothetical protein
MIGALVLGLAGAAVGWLLFTKLLGIGDDDVFDLGGIVSAIRTGTPPRLAGGRV